MTLAFEAKFVDCCEAIGGDLLQVIFDTVPSDYDESSRKTPSVTISRLFEFPGRETVEWHDGRDYDGGAEVVSASLSRTCLSARLTRGLRLEVAFTLAEERYAELVSALERMLGRRIAIREVIPTSGSSQ